MSLRINSLSQLSLTAPSEREPMVCPLHNSFFAFLADRIEDEIGVEQQPTLSASLTEGGGVAQQPIL